MAALAGITATNTGTLSSGAAVTSTDTIDASLLGSRGALLEIINGNASPDAITISDSGLTPAGNALNLSPGGVIADTVTNGTSQVYRIRPEQVNPTTGLVTITHSVTPTVTCKLYPLSF